METRYHINPESGRVNICRSSAGHCPFGAIPHSHSKELVRENYEKMMKSQELSKLSKKAAIPETSAGEKALAPWLDYLKKKINQEKTSGATVNALRADYSRAIAFARSNLAPGADVDKEQSLNRYIDYLKARRLEGKHSKGYNYQEAEASKAEYSRIVHFARTNKLTTR